ncbi:hypothetical protein PR202_gb24099 [Eleusine coracana subsp. coracana]|uniref:Dof zinc finger protein n=2 Tax=Eleusine coracana TaxID=4511 RepID=A0AAV5FK70_ELECO|nr:hypothetical protein QOZ80_5BG0444430 [Eleusine coracana subsp. coracana]QDQ29870.1 DNA-binding with one finger protein [Eleusine coracana]GJN35342.1 hypothetical protein PR202_gb24099 [Eleusine coracana subsp. coracana]
MEAPLQQHYSPVPAQPRRQLDATVAGAASLLPHQAAVLTTMSQINPPPAIIITGGGREQCPRCASRDTKFCYYNNYNTAQPRHFCRACRRYWTLGGSLRNVPVGGSTRKRPRPNRPTKAALAAAMAATSSSAATTRPATSMCGPFRASPAADVPASACCSTVTAHQTGGGLLGSLLLGSVPLLEGRPGFDLGLGSTTPGAGGGDLAHQLGFGMGPLLWPSSAPTVLEGDRATWKSGGVLFPPASALWQEELAAAAGAAQLLL